MIWDVALSKRLLHDGARFQLDIRFASSASRLVLFGPSGAGKTLTVQMMAGLTQPDHGRVAVGGRLLYDGSAGTDLSPQQRRLAYVFQDYALFPHLTVAQNVAFAAQPPYRRWLNPRRRGAGGDARRWIETFQLESVQGHYPHQISGGQRQRTALARALVTEPTALLLDEPFAALDHGLRRHLREELLSLQQTLRIPMLLITHDDEDVRALAEDVVHLQAGLLDGARPASGSVSRPLAGSEASTLAGSATTEAATRSPAVERP